MPSAPPAPSQLLWSCISAAQLRKKSAQAAICLPGDDLLEKLYPDNSAVPDKSVLSFTPALCAAMQVSLCAKWLTGRPVDTGKLHYAGLLYEEYTQIPMR